MSSEYAMDYNEWAKVYDIFYTVGPELEVEFYLELMRTCDGPVLELGVGTGRVAIPAALVGNRVIGVDLHESMLAVARSKATAAGLSDNDLRLVRGDMTHLDLQTRDFGLVIIPGNSLGLILSDSGQQAAIATAARHLKPGGVLAFSMYNASGTVINRDDSEYFLIGVVHDPENGVRHIISGVNDFDRTLQINDCMQYMESISADTGELIDRKELRVVTRYLTVEEAERLVSNAGFEVESIYGDFDRTPYSESSDDMIFVCRKVGSD